MHRSILLAAAAALVPLSAAWGQEPPPAAGPAPAPAAPAPANAYAAPPPLPPSDAPPPTVAFTTREPAGFVAMTPGKAGFALVGAFAMIAAGQQLVKDNDMTDPAEAMSHNLADHLAERTAGSVNRTPVPATALGPPKIAAAAKPAHYVVDVTTMGWSYQYQPLKWTSFSVSYFSRLQVIDATNGALLLKDICTWPAKGEVVPFTSQQALLDDEAKELKARIMKGTLACRARFQEKMDALKL